MAQEILYATTYSATLAPITNGANTTDLAFNDVVGTIDNGNPGTFDYTAFQDTTETDMVSITDITLELRMYLGSAQGQLEFAVQGWWGGAWNTIATYTKAPGTPWPTTITTNSYNLTANLTTVALINGFQLRLNTTVKQNSCSFLLDEARLTVTTRKVIASDNIAISEQATVRLTVLNINVNDLTINIFEVASMLDFPLWVTAFENIIYITEVPTLRPTVALDVFDSITIQENVTLSIYNLGASINVYDIITIIEVELVVVPTIPDRHTALRGNQLRNFTITSQDLSLGCVQQYHLDTINIPDGNQVLAWDGILNDWYWRDEGRITSISHCYGGFQSQAVVIACVQNVWSHLTNVGNNLWNVSEEDGFTVLNDIVICHRAGDYEGYVCLTFSGANGDDYYLRAWNITTATQMGYFLAGTTTGAGNLQTISLPIYLELADNDQFRFEIMNTKNNNDPTVADGVYVIKYLHD